MTLEREHVAELFGLTGSFPRPGWVVLDAARDHRFTGELLFDVDPQIVVYLDRGEIYLAERTTDPSLGARLVDAGALNAAQLEHGSMRIGDAEHLGRLFERVPSVDRQATIVMTEMMNDACVAWLARQHVPDVVSTPYRHHPAGIHRWERAADAVELRPGDPLPAPAPTAAPIEIAPPEPVLSGPLYDDDPLVHWDEPSWLDDRPDDTDPDDRRRSDHGREPSLLADDWADRLEWAGLPAPGTDPLTPTAALPTLPVEPPDRFELIWPSGLVDADFPTSVDGDDDLDIDRAGPTARVGRSGVRRDHDIQLPDDETGLWDFESSRPSFGPDDAPPTMVDAIADPDAADDVGALSMRRAVASIETGSLAARRRLAEAPLADDSSRGNGLLVPGRVATRTEATLWNATRSAAEPARSVFDEPGTEPVSSTSRTSSDLPTSADRSTEPARVSALRRLIGGLRRR